MTRSDPSNLPLLRPYGPRAFLVEGSNQAQRLAWAGQFEQNRPNGFQEWVMGYDTLLLKFDQTIALDEIQRLIKKFDSTSDHQKEPKFHKLPIKYSGPDLEHVARHCKLSPSEVIERHSAASYKVRFLGFSPGFAYLDGLPTELACPRRETPRQRIAAGALAIGGSHTGIYPTSSPGGWNWIGTCPEPIIDSKSTDSPFLLLPGDIIRFVQS